MLHQCDTVSVSSFVLINFVFKVALINRQRGFSHIWDSRHCPKSSKVNFSDGAICPLGAVVIKRLPGSQRMQ